MVIRILLAVTMPYRGDLSKKNPPFTGCQGLPNFFKKEPCRWFCQFQFPGEFRGGSTGGNVIQGNCLEPFAQRKPAFVHKSAAGNGKLPAAARTFVLIPAGDGVIPGTAAMGAGKALRPADTEQLVFINFLVHSIHYTPKIGLFQSCNNLIKRKFDENFVIFTDFKQKNPE
jgi:hypothetical protein